jgi:hypothetical protein
MAMVMEPSMMYSHYEAISPRSNLRGVGPIGRGGRSWRTFARMEIIREVPDDGPGSDQLTCQPRNPCRPSILSKPAAIKPPTTPEIAAEMKR